MKKENSSMISFELSNELKEKLRELSIERESSVSGLIRFILNQYINENYNKRTSKKQIINE